MIPANGRLAPTASLQGYIVEERTWLTQIIIVRRYAMVSHTDEGRLVHWPPKKKGKYKQ
jgi:hypothetical protein